ncbi:MAG TPA: dihydrodipicolinate synthase family protein [Thermoplasmata archaeon]|nr:dihydrodipicolinate synthase family protein [Thermoplasmata archaeon]
MPRGFEFKGIITASLTPLTKKGKIKKDSVSQLVDFQLEHGINGFFLLGTFGEGVELSVFNRKEAAEAFLEHAKEKTPIILHVGAQNTEDAVELAKHAKDLGVKAIGAVAPYFFKPDLRGLVKHYQAIGSASDLPLFIYNNVGKQGYNITPTMFGEIAKGVPQVVGVKDTSYQIPQLQELIHKFGDRYQIIVGGDSVVYAGFVVGAKAHICGISNVFPELAVELYQSIAKGDYEKGKELQYEINDLREVFKSFKVDISPYKSALKLRGIDGGFMTPPLRDLEKEEEKKLIAELKSTYPSHQ